jgi:hypothetical protein
MGHARLDNLDMLMMKQIYAKGKVSIAELAEHAKKVGEGLRASEGEYMAESDYDHPYGMVRMGFEWCIRWHMEDNLFAVIEPILETDDQFSVFEEWQVGDDSFSEEFLEILHSIKWKFSKGGRKAYINDEIDWLRDVTN